jgi:ribosome recycling factor
MELEKVYSFTKEHMEKSINILKKEFATLRTGRVTSAVVESIKIDYYGVPTPLNQAATVVVQDATTIAISPWDKSLLNDIQKAILEANIGVTPNNDGNQIKLFFPPMTTEQRKEEAKKAKKFGEKAKIAVRNIRREANDKIKKAFKNKEISEDEEKKAFEEVQKITDNFIGKIDESVRKAEHDILRI